MPNSTFIVRHVWIAFVGKAVRRTVFRSSSPLQSGCRPRLQVGAASQFMAGSNQIASEPQRLSASL
jgi:hypothetical protein